MDEGACQEARDDPDSRLAWVRLVVGHIPDLPDDAAFQWKKPSLLVLASETGPDRIGEHQVRLESGEFDVRVWSGVGQRDGFCPTDPDGGRSQIGCALLNDQSNDASDHYFVLCVSFRYVGELPTSPA